MIQLDSHALHTALDIGAVPASVNVSRFRGQDGVEEIHLAVQPAVPGNIEVQLDWIERAYRDALKSFGLGMNTAVLRRFFCSDLTNQTAALQARPFSNPRDAGEPCAISWVCQPPLPPAKAALWAYHVNDPGGELVKNREEATLALARGEISHCWTTGLVSPRGNPSYDQTRDIFEAYEADLRARGMSLADNVMRTWLFVRDIDPNYKGMVAARREFFAEHGLTADTHYIASSGIGGPSADAAVSVAMDAYAISGVRPEQIEYLKALDHLSPTQVYGVTFERGTSVAWRDRKHIYISGTASIDPEGNILHVGDVRRQFDRTIENIEALLDHAGAGLEDMCSLIAYVRDPSDQALAERMMREQFGEAPIAVVAAPVCRPGWLIEVEGIGIAPSINPELPAF